jgi:hypothetical protein
MPKASSSGHSNAAAGEKVDYFNEEEVAEDREQQLGLDTAVSAELDIKEDEPSAGTSSLTSESKPDRSGTSPPETGSSLRSPAPDVESPSGKDQPQKQTSSSASLTAGSTQETGSVPARQQASSAASAAPTPATQGQDSKPEAPKSNDKRAGTG